MTGYNNDLAYLPQFKLALVSPLLQTKIPALWLKGSCLWIKTPKLFLCASSEPLLLHQSVYSRGFYGHPHWVSTDTVHWFQSRSKIFLREYYILIYYSHIFSPDNSLPFIDSHHKYSIRDHTFKISTNLLFLISTILRQNFLLQFWHGNMAILISQAVQLNQRKTSIDHDLET